jgi:hypothetical protein
MTTEQYDVPMEQEESEQETPRRLDAFKGEHHAR